MGRILGFCLSNYDCILHFSSEKKKKVIPNLTLRMSNLNVIDQKTSD